MDALSFAIRCVSNRQSRNKDFAESDRLRAEIAKHGVIIEDGPGGTYTLRKA